MTTINSNSVKEGIAIDLETGGLDPYVHGIRSIGIWIDNTDYMYIVIKPEANMKYDDVSEKITGLTIKQMKEEGVDESKAVVLITEYLRAHSKSPLEKPFLIGQNLQFDIGFLKAMFKRHCKFLTFDSLVHHHYLDSMHMKLTLRLIGLYKGPISLDQSFEYIIGKKHQAHNALEDAKASKMEIEYLKKLK